MADQARTAAAAAAATPSAAATSTRASRIVLTDLSDLTYGEKYLANRGKYPKAYHRLRVRKGLAPATAIEFVDDFCSWHKSNNIMRHLPSKDTTVGFAQTYSEIVKKNRKNRQGTDLPADDGNAYAAAAGRRYDQYSVNWLAQVTQSQGGNSTG